MNEITLVFGYYDQPQTLDCQISNFWSWPADVRAHWWINVVDDASPVHPAWSVWDPHVRVFRVLDDVLWNDKGARNIGAHEATTEWLLVTDIDHLVPVETARALVEGEFDPRRFYGFTRQLENGDRFRPHRNSHFLSTALWDRIGGCDERLSGCYGGSELWRGRAEQAADAWDDIEHPLILVESGDAMTNLVRRYPGDIDERRRRRKSLVGPPITMSFAYERVA